jgi:menaquinol-cytochrome c reductase iron-sulfur subunit
MNEKPNDITVPDQSLADEVSRRKFFERLSVVLGLCAAAGLAVPMAGFIIAPLFRTHQRAWRPVGRADSFKIGETVAVRYEDASPLEWAGVTARTAAWLRRESENAFVAFSINCSHLGCPVRWLPNAELFMCPCHGGVYYRDGQVAAGPPPEPLTRYPVRVNAGQVEILASPIPVVQSK